MIASATGTTAAAGGNHGKPIYLVPATPVAAYAPVSYAPVAYGPVAYAPVGHHHKWHNNAAPVAAYGYPVAAAPAAYPFAAAAAPTAYTTQAAAAPATYVYTAAAAPAAAAQAAAAPGASTYQWQLVKTSGNGAGAAPGTDSGIPLLSDLTSDQNDKLRQLLKSHLATLSGTALSADAKQNNMIDWANSTYADLLGTTSSALTSTQQENAKKVALAVLGNAPESGTTTSSAGTQTIQIQALAAPAYPQLFLPMVPAHGGLFHHKYR